MTFGFLHIPRTGGRSRIEAGVRSFPHRMTLRDVPEDVTPVVYVRDPVARFLSAYGVMAAGWPSAEALATTIEWPTSSLLRPQAYWLDADRDDVILLRAEHMDETLPLLEPSVTEVPHVGHASTVPPSANIVEAIRRRYASDYEIVRLAL